jgi:hypothetical protein
MRTARVARRGSPPVQVARAKALACQLPAQSGLPLSRWSCPDLARQIIDAGIADSISASTIRRWLATDAIKPWQHQSWIFISDPDFAAKAARVLDLYARVWNGKPLSANDYVISADEKTSIQGALPLPPLHAGRQGPDDAGQPRLRPRPEGHRPAGRAVPERDHGAHPGARVLAQSGLCGGSAS